MTARVLLILICVSATGCLRTMVDVGVTNPIPGFSKVAIVPFFNLSDERAVDGRRFASAYFAELQKVPGFEVLPTGIAEQAIYDHGLAMDNPDDVLKLAGILDVDAVVIGAVTDYSPYYPPRIGLKISWYSPRPWAFFPGLPIDAGLRDEWRHAEAATACEDPHDPPEGTFKNGVLRRGWDFFSEEDRFYRRLYRRAATPPVFRGQSDDALLLFPEDEMPPFFPGLESESELLEDAGPASIPAPRMAENSGLQPVPAALPLAPASPDIVPVPGPAAPDAMLPPPAPAASSVAPPAALPGFDPREPLMSYTRMFDGADLALVATLRDYVALNGDLRSGAWQAYLYRSEDFIRFTAHLTIVEMLSMHGGESYRRVVVRMRHLHD